MIGVFLVVVVLVCFIYGVGDLYGLRKMDDKKDEIVRQNDLAIELEKTDYNLALRFFLAQLAATDPDSLASPMYIEAAKGYNELFYANVETLRGMLDPEDIPVLDEMTAGADETYGLVGTDIKTISASKKVYEAKMVQLKESAAAGSWRRKLMPMIPRILPRC